MIQIIDRCRKYFYDVLEVNASISEFKEINQFNIPFVILDNYLLYNLKLFEKNFILLIPKRENEFTPASYYKQIKIVKHHSNLEVILMKSWIDSFNRKRLIGYKIPFIVPGTQMYLPSLMIDLREHFTSIKATNEIYSPATQSLFLYMITHNERDAYNVDKFQTISGYSRATIRRSIIEFENNGIGDIVKNRKNKILTISENIHSLWKQNINKLRNPIIKEIWLSHLPQNQMFPEAGLSALSQYTMISPLRNETFAVWKNEWNILSQNNSVKKLIEPEKTENNIILQIWSYSPTLWSTKQMVDKYSLYLSLRENKDARIEQALEEMLNEVLNGYWNRKV
ncbi:MAG: hypothetical protein P9L97_09720 [Candidatus Tenebribacter davisii]|nr:hypothetical protein [Candidatus Tenebribacter davisii]